MSDKLQLEENEKIVRVVYHHPEIIIPNLVICALILLTDFFLMYFLFLQGVPGIIIFSVIILVVCFYLFRLVFLYKTNKFILTSKRLLDLEQTGFFELRINSIPYKKISSVEVIMKGLGSSLFKYGNLKIKFGKPRQVIELYKISHPVLVQSLLNEHLSNPERDLVSEEEEVPNEVDQLEKKSAGEEKNEPAKLHKITKILEEVESLSTKEKENLLAVLEEELSEDEVSKED